MKRLVPVLAVLILLPFAASKAQLYAPNDEGVSMGQWHTIVSDVAATKKFWITLGGQSLEIDGTQVIKMPGFFIFLTPGTPSGGTYGSVANHLGFFVPNVREAIAKWRAAGVTAVEASDLDGYVFSPDDLKLEIKLNDVARDKLRVLFNGLPPNVPGPNPPLERAHLHYWVPKSEMLKVQAWYFYMFGGTPGAPIGALHSPTIDGIPGLHFSLANSQDPNALPVGLVHGAKPDAAFLARVAREGVTLPTKGRALDYIGFEVENLSTFCKKLEAKGIRFDQPYSTSRHKSFASAELTNPWGLSLELTEGLKKF